MIIIDYSTIYNKKRNMAKNQIILKENELNTIIEECVMEALNEGLGDQLRASWQGAKQAFKGQKMLDRGVDNFKQNWTRDDEASIANPYASRPENTAAMQAKEAYDKYKYYKSESDKYLALYNKLTNKYDLNKDGIGQRSTKEKVVKGAFGGTRPKQNYSYTVPNARGYNRVTDFRREEE